MLWEAFRKTGSSRYMWAMLWGERAVRAIIDAEMAFSGYVRLDRKTEARLSVYLDDDEQARLLADAEIMTGKPQESLSDAFIMLMPDDYDIQLCMEGLKARPFPAAARLC